MSWSLSSFDFINTGGVFSWKAALRIVLIAFFCRKNNGCKDRMYVSPRASVWQISYMYDLLSWSICWTFSQYLKLWFITEHKTYVHFSYLQETTMIRRWSKPKSFSGGGTPRRRDDPDGPISKCTILDVDVSHMRFVALRLTKPPSSVNKMLMFGFFWQMDRSPEAPLRRKNGTKAGRVQKLRPREVNCSGLTIKQILETSLPSLCTRLSSYQQIFSAFDSFSFTSVLISLWRHCLSVPAGR